MVLKVLIAHGNIQRLQEAVRDLEAAGVTVIATPDGGDAFARFFEELPNLVICSESLPGLSGPNFASMVRSQSPETPVVLLSDSPQLSSELGFTVLSDSLDVNALKAVFPDLFANLEPHSQTAPEQIGEKDLTILAALKSFQRGGHLLTLFDEAGILRVSQIARHEAHGDNEQVIRQGDMGDGFYLVVTGQVRVTLAEKNEQEVARIGAGGFFGEMALLAEQPRSASVWSVGPTALLWFDRKAFLPLFEDYPTARDVLSGVALQRTEDNLWRVLFADDDVQRSLAGLDLAAPEQPEAAAEKEENSPPAQKTRDGDETIPSMPALTRDDATAPDLGVVFKMRRASFLMRHLAVVVGLGFGLLVGIIFTGLIFLGRERTQIISTVIEQKENAPSSSETEPDTKAVAADSENAGTQNTPVEEKTQPDQAPPPPDPDEKSQPAQNAPALAQETPTPANASPAERKDLRKNLFAALKNAKFGDALGFGYKLRDSYGLDWESQFALANAERQNGKLNEALENFRDFLKKYPTNSFADDASYYMAQIFVQQGNVKEAKTALQPVAANPKSNFQVQAAEQLHQLAK